ncbi:MAG: hypothetical protein R3300_20945, partial [Candidatus Promineifilaceae bacterium]|nr:hypothetical protein [Candidatus Promineifilaceae bacterium]
MPIQAVIFDLGGTIVHYAGEHDRWPDLERPGLAAAYDYLGKGSVALPSLEEFVTVAFDRLPQRWRKATGGQQNLTVED